MLEMYYIGIDPGTSGAVAYYERGSFLEPFSDAWSHERVETIGDTKIFDINSYMAYLPNHPRVMVAIEQVIILSGQRSAALIGANYGVCLSAAVSKYGERSVFQVHPSAWKMAVLGEGKHTKEESIARAQELGFEIPTLRPKGKILNHNIAEAYLIAHYAEHFLTE